MSEAHRSAEIERIDGEDKNCVLSDGSPKIEEISCEDRINVLSDGSSKNEEIACEDKISVLSDGSSKSEEIAREDKISVLSDGSSKIEEMANEDRISMLNDDLLIQILLLVPTKDAVATMFLSRRWRFVWRKLPRLDYRETKNNSGIQSKSVWWFLDETMRFHEAPLLEMLCIELGPHFPVDVDVVKWVAKAVDRSIVRQLSFNLLWNSEPIKMPKSLYTCKTLTNLTLSNKILVDDSCSVYLPSLEELVLYHVMYKDEDAHVKFLSGCPNIKSLKVFRNVDMDDNVIKFIVKVPSLQKLTYMDTYFEEDTEKSLVIDTPNLTDLDIFDTGLGHTWSIEYMPRLTLAVVAIALDPVDNFLKSLSLVRLLKLVVMTMVPWGNVFFPLLEWCNIYGYELNWGEALLVFISNCPKLNTLVVCCSFKNYESENHVQALWNQPDYIPKCLSSHLTKFKWNGYAGRQVEKELIRYVLGNSKCLTEMEISFQETCNSGDKQKMVEELESMPRVSKSPSFTFQIW